MSDNSKQKKITLTEEQASRDDDNTNYLKKDNEKNKNSK